MVLIKLTTTNYLTWSTLFALIFCWYNFTGFIDDKMVAPSKFLLDESGNRTATLNPQYVALYENDQNILIWINSTLSDTLIPYTVGVNSARELWSKLESRLATASQSHIYELHSRLRTIMMGDFTAVIYFQQIEEIADALTNASAPIEDSKLIYVILHGLLSEYESFIDVVQFQLSSTTIDELHGLFLSKELHARKEASPPTPSQAFNSSAGLFATPLMTLVLRHSLLRMVPIKIPPILSIVAISLILEISIIVALRGITKDLRVIRGSIVEIKAFPDSIVVLVLTTTILTEKISCQIYRQMDHEAA